MRDWMPFFIGKLSVAFAVQRFPAGQLFGGGQMQSPTAGGSWTGWQYAVAAGVTWLGSRTVGKWMGNASAFRKGAMDLILTKLIWTEGIARQPIAQQMFGNSPIRYDPRNGSTWISQGNQYASMQGEIVEASPLDGEIVEASPLDGSPTHHYGRMVPRPGARGTARRQRRKYADAYAF